MKEFVFPSRIVASVGVQNAKNLVKKCSLQIGLTEGEDSLAACTAGGYVILDYGKELCASLRLLTFVPARAKVHVRFGESLTECCATLGGEQNATNDHAIRDYEVELPEYSDITLPQTGFRFVRIDFLGDVR